MTTSDAQRFIEGLRGALAGAVGRDGLLAVTEPPADAGIERLVDADAIRIDGRIVASPIPRVTLRLPDALEAARLAEAWGIGGPIAVAVDVHQRSWRLAARGAPLEEPGGGRRVVGDDVVAGCWILRAGLEGRPPGGLPDEAAGASPAYDLHERPGLVRTVTVERRPLAVRLAHAGDPAPTALFDAARARNPYARPGWSPDAAAPVVLVEAAGGSPAAAATLAIDTAAHLGLATAITVAGDAPDPAAAAADLVDALEAVSLDAGAVAIRFDATAFLVDPAVLRLADRGYIVGPPYDGDADVAVWAERRLAG